MRLGDLDLAEKAIEEDLNIETGARYMALADVIEVPEINPESLPIVQQLRAEIKRLNGEITKCRDELNRANTALDSAAKWYLFHAE